MTMDSFKWQLATVVSSIISAIAGYAFSAQEGAISMTTILTLLNSTKLSVYPPFPMFPFNLLFGVIVFALLLANSVCVDTQYDECQNNQTCGSISLVFPFRTPGCGLKDFQIDCVDDLRPVLQINSAKYTILDVFPNTQSFTMATEKSFQTCSDDVAESPDLSDSIFTINNSSTTQIPVYKCEGLAGCAPYGPLFTTSICPLQSQENVSFKLWTVNWKTTQELGMCQACVITNGYCGYNCVSDVECFYENGSQSDQCPKGKTGKLKVAVIVGVAAGIGILLIVAVLLLLRAFLKRASSSASKVEIFLQDFTNEMPTRYSYSQLKKITNNFANKLGEGGFGQVYKGKLSTGYFVAVKILDQSRQSESQFMNEVATIGRIHHVHLVHLMGYCFEPLRSALVYEYMANGSLEKFIFVKKEKPQMLSWEQLYSIALGAARGIVYLHQDCDRRIIHFDIKPHNILLDADFTPKVSDFGLAKLCGRLEDHISITAAMGTPGYVAPELCLRNLGPVTDKADVYSFGMLLLEIVGRRKNVDTQVSRPSEVYFPDWAFKFLEKGELEERLRGRIGEEMGCQNDMQVLRMCKVGIWCIQYNSMDRPTMSKVVQMLEGIGDEVSNPPFPFNSSESPQRPLMSSTEESSFV